MAEYSVSFETPQFLWLFLLAIAPIAFSYVRVRHRNISAGRRIGQMSLRVVAITCVVMSLAGMRIVTNKGDVSMVILADGSDSAVDYSQRMENDIQAVIEQSDEYAQVDVIIFAGDTQSVDRSAQTALPFAMEHSLNGEATNIANALIDAVDLLANNTRKRIVLLTDGIQTESDALSVASLLSRKGIRVDAIQYANAAAENEAEVKQVEVPLSIALGQSAVATVTLACNAEMDGILFFYDDETFIEERKIHIPVGESHYKFDVLPTSTGTHTYRAELEIDVDKISQNNQMFACTEVTASDTILILDGTGEDGGNLEELLTANGYHVERLPCAQIPRTISSLCEYGLIILMNVNDQDLQATSSKLLQQYVELYGRSVLTTGGDNTYVWGHMLETPFDEFLPIEIQVQDEASVEPIALVLVIDNSASMGETSTNLADDYRTPVEIAKLGAVKCINALNDNDYAGVITFSDKHYVLSALISAKNKNALITEISKMGTISGTMYQGALLEAYQQLLQADASLKKHVIFISDGNPSDTGYEEIIKKMQAQGMTVSAIGIGQDINVDIMSTIAELGGGQFSHALDTEDLPSMMLSETILQHVTYKAEGVFQPNARSTWVADAEVLPLLYGYIRASAKAGAQTQLMTDTEHPIYVQWQYGQGKVGAWMSDLSGQWSRDWFLSDDGLLAITRMIDALMPQMYTANAISAEMISGGTTCTLRVSYAEENEQHTLEAEVIAPNGTEYSSVLSRVRNGIYEYTMPLSGFGKYDMTIHQYADAAEEPQLIQTAATLSWSSEYEAFPTVDEKEMLTQLCHTTGGDIAQDVKRLFAMDLSSLFVRYDPIAILAFIGALAFMLEIVLRRKRRKKNS